MIFEKLELAGAVLVRLEPNRDTRGYFARTFCAQEFARAGLTGTFVQCNTSFNTRRGTLRGMHYQAAPGEEGKLVRCTRGAIYDVIIDLRPDSDTYRRWVSAKLSEDNGDALYIPPGFAHGFQTLTDDAEVLYQMTEYFQPALAHGVRWNDRTFGINWPIADPILSDKDAGYEDFKP